MRILFVAFGSSIHTARWISQLRDEKWDIHLFPVDEYYLHPDLRDVTVHFLFKNRANHIDSSVRQRSFSWPFRRGETRFRNAVQRLPRDFLSNAARLARVIRSLKPDVIHSMDIEGGVLTFAGYERMSDYFPPWIHSSWGSDIFYFGSQPDYADRVRLVLSSCNYLMADCKRELELAPSFGFKGEALGVFSAAGGFHIDHMRQFRSTGPASARRLIMLKGRQGHLGGRALFALQALHKCADVLGEYEIVVYMPQGDKIVTYAAEYISFVTGLRFTVLPDHTPHDEMLKLMGSARIAIALGMTDGTPHAMLEAMAMGAFPIQSNTADTRGWIEDGKNGLLVPPEDANAIGAAIRKSIADDQMVDQAADLNAQITKERIDIGIVGPRVVEVYKRIAEHAAISGP